MQDPPPNEHQPQSAVFLQLAQERPVQFAVAVCRKNQPKNNNKTTQLE
jgi:hypothetical protein